MSKPIEGQPEGRHIADQRSLPGQIKTAEFLRLSRTPRETFHVARETGSPNRLSQFLRIARGREVWSQGLMA